MSPISYRVAQLALMPSILLACDVPSEPGDLEQERLLDDEGEADSDVEPIDDAPTLPLGAEAPPVDPEPILNGWVYDSDRDVMVLTPYGMCTGTLVRNDVVSTQLSCLDGGPHAALETEGPLGDWMVIQDGPGASLGAVRSIVSWEQLYSVPGIVVLQLDEPFEIDGRTMGASTQIYGRAAVTMSGQVVPCQGFGRDTGPDGSGVLRAGLAKVWSSGPMVIHYHSVDGYDQIQFVGDLGSSCRDTIFQAPRLRKMLGVLYWIYGEPKATSYSSDQFRDPLHEKLDEWAGGDLLDDFSTPELYEIDEPAVMYGGPSNWQIAGGMLTESSNAHLTANFEGTRFVNSAEVVNDGGVAVTVSSPDDDGAGLVLRVRDDTHYYRFSVDEQRGFARIVRRKGNAFLTLGENASFDIDWSTSPRLEFHAEGGLLTGYVDGVAVVAGFDTDVEYTAGRVGVYQWGLANATFDDLEIIRD